MKRLILVLLLLLIARSASAAATVVQTKVEESTGTCSGTPTSCTITFGSNVTTGNAVIVTVVCVSCSTNTFSASDGVNGAYTKYAELSGAGGGSYTSTILAFRGATGGFATVTTTVDSGTPVWYMWAWEVSGLSTGTVQTGTMDDGCGCTSHTTSSSALSGTGFGVSIAGVGVTPIFTAGSGWTQLSTNSIFGFAQYRTGTITSNTGPYTADTASNSRGAMCIFPETVAGGCRKALMGVGC